MTLFRVIDNRPQFMDLDRLREIDPEAADALVAGPLSPTEAYDLDLLDARALRLRAELHRAAPGSEADFLETLARDIEHVCWSPADRERYRWLRLRQAASTWQDFDDYAAHVAAETFVIDWDDA
jgi:hypothetical protein